MNFTNAVTQEECSTSIPDFSGTTENMSEWIGTTNLHKQSICSELKRCGEYICPSKDMVSLHPGFHVAAVLVFGVYGLSANAITIYMYSTKTTYSGGKLYILLLAILDIGSILMNLPQFIILGHIPCCVVKWTSAYPYTIILGIYIFILDAMALERLAALFQPFKFQRNRNIVKKLVIITILIWLLVTVFKLLAEILMLKIHYYILRLIMWLLFSLGFLCMASTYPVITFKLFTQKRKHRIGENQPNSVQMDRKGINKRGNTRLV